MVHHVNQLAAAGGERIALRDGHGARTWAEVNDTLNRATNALLALGLEPGARVAVFAENAAETLIAHLATLLAGASSVPINFHLTADEVAYILTDADAQVLFIGPETSTVGVAAATAARTPLVIGWGEPTAADTYLPVAAWDTWLAAASADEPPTDHAPQPNLLYTSGTTGRPKGTQLPPTMFAGGATIAEHLDILRANPFAQLGTHLVVGPMYHTGPLTSVRILAAGVPVVILGRFDAATTLDAIERHAIESTVMVPTHFIRLLQHAGHERADVSSLQLVVHTGSACPIEVKRAMIDWWGPVLVEAYGATEVGTTCQITSEEWLEHPGSVGRAAPPFTALVIDDDGTEQPPNTEGQLYFEDATGRGVVYHGDPEKSAAAHLRPGVFTLGEIGYVDDDGYVYITDRFSDMIVSGGVNIYPAESEQVLLTHPGVADVAVIGVPHAEMGEEVKALVVPLDPVDPPTEAELLAFCRASLSHYKCPRSVELVDTIGRTTMGKVNKRSLRAPYWAADRHQTADA